MSNGEPTQTETNDVGQMPRFRSVADGDDDCEWESLRLVAHPLARVWRAPHAPPTWLSRSVISDATHQLAFMPPLDMACATEGLLATGPGDADHRQ